MSETNAEALVEAIEKFSEDFSRLCQERYDAGAEEYGHLTFIGNDVIRMMMEELADTANYCHMQFIKLSLLQAMLEDETAGLSQDGGTITIGVQSFKGTGSAGWRK